MGTNAVITRMQPDHLFASDAQRWQAVVHRDKQAAASFIYSVKTTGVYCRPSCPARLPRREHVRFHATTAEAERAGFRPCKRCRPKAKSFTQQHQAAVATACRIIEEAAQAPGLEALAAEVGMSPFHFHRVFKSLTGVTPKAFAVAHRTQRVRAELAQDSAVTAAVYGAGYQSTGPFYAQSSEMLGMTPTAFRSGGRGAVIRFAVGQCSLGAILVAASERGVCEISLGDDPAALTHELEGRFPQAELAGGDEDFEKVVATVIGLVERPLEGIELPLDVQGTAFQQRVWQLLRDIPCGQTISYAELAQRLGKPNAVRAVASACAANKIALAIPCHRVVRTDGSPSGYRWGVERKEELQKRESARS